jgi:hypothetical protein
MIPTVKTLRDPGLCFARRARGIVLNAIFNLKRTRGHLLLHREQVPRAS